MRVDPDKINNADTEHTAHVTMMLLNAVQRQPKHYRVLAAAAFLVTLLEAYKLNPQDVMGAAANLMNHAEGRRAEFLAVRLHAENEE